METIFFREKTQKMRIDRYLELSYPHLSKNTLFKTFRKKDIKVNNRWVANDYILVQNDKIDIYLEHSILDAVEQIKEIETVYQDSNILIVNKPRGLQVQPSVNDNISLDEIINNQIKPSQFRAELCHRLDRNTGGLVILAKNQHSLNLILNQFKNGSIQKFYICYVEGVLPKKYDVLESYLVKNPLKSQVFIYDKFRKNSKKITTVYKVLDYKNNITKLEIELKTGKTHQIRAHLAHIGYPVIGDFKYGSTMVNRKYNQKHQALWAYKIIFSFPKNSHLHYLNDKVINIPIEFKICHKST